MPYLGPSPVTTTTGIIADPANTPATRADCLPYACFADGGSNTGARAWCAYYGFMDSYNCQNPACAPYRSQIQTPGCGGSAPAPAPFPSVPPVYMTPQIASQSPDSRTLSPSSLLRPLPQIVPQPRTPAPQHMCGGPTGWIGQNPLLAVAGLVGLYLLLGGGK